MTDFQKRLDRANAALKAEGRDDTKTQTSFSRRVIPTGTVSARFVEYIELGLQPQPPFQGKAKEPANEVRLTFELLGKDNIRKLDDGTEIADRISVPMTIMLSDRAKYKKFFNAMAEAHPDKTFTAMPQMLGLEFQVQVIHEEGRDGNKYPRIVRDGNPLIFRAEKEVRDEDDNVIGYNKIKVRPAIGKQRIFLFNHPTKEDWDDLFIEGEREVTDKVTGEKTNVSKNFIQEKIMAALNFKGSAVEAMLQDGLTQEDEDALSDTIQEDADVFAEGDSENQELPEREVVKPKASPASAKKAAAAMDALGLTGKKPASKTTAKAKK